MKKTLLTSLLVLVMMQAVRSQCLQPVNFQLQKSLAMPSPSTQLNMTAHRDTAVSKPYLYISGKGAGLLVYNISSIASPSLVATVSIFSLNGLHVMSSTQAGNYLYLALGDHFNASAQKSGMAIVDISNPASPVVKDTYSYTTTSGAGQVAVDGNYAYLSAMQNGIIVLDVTNKSNIIFKSVFKPSIHFPKVNPDASEQDKINVRQIVVKNDILYVCYDAGGLRIVNAANKMALVETGHYSNPLLNSRPRAYNNLVLNDSLVYVATDYCGLEILNVKDTANISQLSWWNPWHCETPANDWFNSIGHANEIEFDPVCKLVFMSAGRSDLFAVNVNNPLLPDSCARFGIPGDSLGTWGVGRYNNQIYLSYIYAAVPFYVNWGGTKILSYDNNCSTTGFREITFKDEATLFPNPASDRLSVKQAHQKPLAYKIFNALGTECSNGKMQGDIDVSELKSGVYLLMLYDQGQNRAFRFIKE
jgi:hypothetical protein